MISPGNQIGRYKVLSLIGVGGMGEVFLALDVELDRLVALKILPKEVAKDKERIRRFIHEAKATSSLNHPNILTIHEIGLVDGIRFIASEYIKGITLRDKLKQETLSLSEILEIAVQIASALHIAHSSKIIHRDIKPENIMIREDNLVKVLDFGLAKLNTEKTLPFDSKTPTYDKVNTKSGMILGTLSYMSPEQTRGKKVDQRTDIFSLGVILYEMLTGIKPFSGDTNSDIIAAILTKEPQKISSLNPEVPPEIERIVLKTLCKDCNDRYQKAQYLMEELSEFKQDLDFQSKINRKSSVNELAEAKTKTLEAHTSPTINIETGSLDAPPTDKNLLSKFTTKFNFSPNLRLPILIFLILIATGLFTYFLLPAFWSVSPKSEAVKLFNYGMDSMREGTYYKASKMFEDAIAIDANYSDAHAGLAEAWMELDYFGRAQGEMLKVNELQNKKQSIFSSFYKTDDELYIEAINAIILRNFSQAINNYQKIAERNPAEPNVYVDLGRVYEKNEEIDKAIEAYQKAISINPLFGAAFLRMGILQRRKSEYEKANESFNNAANIYERFSNDEGIAEVKYQRGVALNNQEKLEAAREQFEQVIKTPRVNKYQQIRAMLQISNTCSSEGKTTCAEEYASKAIALAKDERMENVATTGLIDLGNAFLARSEYDKAEQNFQQALTFARKDEGLKNEAITLLALASLRIQQTKPDEAKSFVNQALPFLQNGGYSKEVSQANLILGRASEMKEDYNAALLAYEQVEKAENASFADRASANMFSGYVLIHQENYPEALRRFEHSYDLFQSVNDTFYSAYCLFALSDVMFQLGNFEEAKAKLVQAQAILKEEHPLFSQLNFQISLLNAQIAFSRRNFSEAVSEVKKTTETKDDVLRFEANKIICRAKTALNSKSTEGIQNCLNALQYAESTKDARTINTAKLALAEAYFNTGNYPEALKTALSAKDYFVKGGQLESGWRAWLIAAQACQQKNDFENGKGYAAQALSALSTLQKNWNQESSNLYMSKPDINFYIKQAEQLALP